MLNLYERSLTGASTSTDTLLLDTPDHKNTCDWSADARFVLYAVQSVTSAADLWALPLFGDRKPLLVAQTPANDVRGQFFPDGKSVAYESNESGRAEIYLQAFPDPIWKVQINRRRHGAHAPMMISTMTTPCTPALRASGGYTGSTCPIHRTGARPNWLIA